MRERLARLVAAATGLLILAAVLLFGVLQQRAMTRVGTYTDPQAWAALYPRHYESFMQTATDYGRTPYGGSVPYDKLEANPFRRRAWAGHPFALEYNAARGHYYAQIDQRTSRRTTDREQPAGCIHCHAAEAPRLVEESGWTALHRLSYDDLRDRLHTGSSCTDCHAPDTMALTITRPAFVTAMQQRGIDVRLAARTEMRTYVCAQCHVEYYFRGPDRELVLPWSQGLDLEAIERHYDETGFDDWTHAETGAGLIKIQHPEFELHSMGAHAAAGVSCADCHMPRVEARGLGISDHWIRSPLTQPVAACGGCHRMSEDDLRGRVVNIQRRTTRLVGDLEMAIDDLMQAIVAARDAGAPPAALEAARRAHRRAQIRWDFVDAENSTGFHSPGEAARILTEGLALARDGEQAARTAVIRAARQQ